MSRAAWILAAACSHRVAHPAPVATCVEPDKAYAQRDAAAAANKARFDQALAERKLELVALDQIGLPGGDNGEGPVGFAIDQVQAANNGSASVSVVTGFSGICGDRPVEFAREGAKIFRVARAPKPGKSAVIEMCGCPSPQFTCGGAREVSRPIGYVLPASTTFAGVAMIDYIEDIVTPERAASCPYVPPPP